MQQPTGQSPIQYGLPLNNAPLPIILNTQPDSRVKGKYKAKRVKILSIMQIILGSLAIIFQIWDIINGSNIGEVGAGIWTGTLFITAGTLGVLSSNSRTTYSIVSFLVMSIIASVFTIALLVASAINVQMIDKAILNIRWERRHTAEPRPYHLKDSYLEGLLQKHGNVAAISGILIIIALTEAVVAVFSSCYACDGLCKSTSQQGSVHIQGQIQYIPGSNGQTQMVIVPMGNQANLMTDNPPPYQLSTSTQVLQTQSLVAPPGELLADQDIPPTIPQLHQTQAVGTVGTLQPPTYSRQMTPPPEYEEKERGLQGEGST